MSPDSTHADHADHAEHAERAERAAGDHGSHDMGSIRAMAASATLHCLTGCAIGEIAGLVVGAAAGLSNGATIVLSIALAFFFGYGLSTMPLLRAGLPVRTALRTVLAADTVSIATMEVVDNLVVAVIPGAMDAGLVDALFWLSMVVSLVVAFAAAYPVNLYLLGRGKGHALTHEYHDAPPAEGVRRLIPTFGSGALAAALTAFMLGGLLVSLAAATA